MDAAHRSVILEKRLQLTLALFLLISFNAVSDTLYVDGTISSPCSTYNPINRNCSTGSDRAFPILADGVDLVSPGDVVVIRGGSFQEQLYINVSGLEGAPITVRGATGETAIIEQVNDPALFIQNAGHIVIENLTVRDVRGWGRLEDAHHITIHRVTFERALSNGTTGGFKIVRATQCTIDGNSFIDGNDNITMQESDENRIVNNVFREGRHSLLSVRCSNRNVFRSNRFSNTTQKAMEIYDCEGISDAPYLLDKTQRNLIEQNRFEHTRESDQDHDYNGIQYAGQQGIVRRNVFFDNLGGGLAFQNYEDEALYNYEHHAYHNTFVDNRCHGIIGSRSPTSTRFHSNEVRYNVLLGNADCGGQAVQTNIRNPGAVHLSGNMIVDSDPGFSDRSGRDFTLTSGSSLIDAAGYLAQAVGTNSGTLLTVNDAYPFFDGNGIEAEPGDIIQLEGSTERATVVFIDLTANVLTLSRPLTWTDGQGVSLAYEGDGPDVGAYERGLANLVPDPGVVPGPGGAPMAGDDTETGSQASVNGQWGGGCAVSANGFGFLLWFLGFFGVGQQCFRKRTCYVFRSLKPEQDRS